MVLTVLTSCATFIRPCTGTLVIILYNTTCLFYSYDEHNTNMNKSIPAGSSPGLTRAPIGFNGAETNCRIAHILGILLMNSCNTDIFFSNYYHLQSVRFEILPRTFLIFGIDEIYSYFIVVNSEFFKLAILKYQTSCA